MTTPQTDAPERIWAVHWNTYGAVLNGAWADTVRHFGGGVEYVRADMIENWRREIVLRHLSNAGQAADALDAHEATIAALVEALDRIVIASDYYGKEPVDHDELTLAYAHQSTGNIARATLAKAAALKGSSNAHK